MQKTFDIIFSVNEAAILLNLLDGAVRHFGRPAAQSVAYFSDRIEAAVKAAAEIPKQDKTD